MGIWNDVSSMLSKGASAAERFADATSLKFKLGEEQRKRRDLATSLGESLYEEVALNPSLAAGREHILADMAACDTEIARLKAEIDRIAQENEAIKADSVSYSCPACGSTLARDARFCSTCGTPLAPMASSGWASQAEGHVEDASQQPVGTEEGVPQQPMVGQEPGQGAVQQPVSYGFAVEQPQAQVPRHAEDEGSR